MGGIIYARLKASVSNFAEGQQWLGGIDEYVNFQTSQSVTVHVLHYRSRLLLMSAPVGAFT